MRRRLVRSAAICALIGASTPGCDRGTKCRTKDEALSRLSLGLKYVNGEGMAKDENRAFVLFTEACECGEPRACSNLGMMYEKGNGVPKDDKRAVAMYTKACEGFKPACTNLGVKHASGEGVPQDKKRAAELFKIACFTGEDAVGCFNAGLAWELGQGVPKNAPRAAGLYKKACDSGFQQGCQRMDAILRVTNEMEIYNDFAREAPF